MREIYQVNPQEETAQWNEEEFQRVSQFLERLSEAKPEYQGQWEPICYTKGDIVVDGGWQMIANKDTCDRAAPQPVGDAFWLLPDAPAWTDLSVTDIVYSGVRISNITLAYQFSALRVWIPNVTADASYRVMVVDNLTGKVDIGQPFFGTILSTPGWASLLANEKFLLPGDDVSVLLVSQNSSGTTDFNHPWVYLGSSNQETDPGIGNVSRRGDNTRLRINKTDRDGTDRSAELLSVINGSLLKVASEGDLSAYIEYEVTGGYVDNVGWVNYTVVLRDIGASGEPLDNDNVQVYFEIPVATPTDYVRLDDHFADNPSLQGQIQIGEGATVYDDHAYGIDITVQQYSASEDWDILSVSGSGGGSTAAEASATQMNIDSHLYDTTTHLGGTLLRSEIEAIVPMPWPDSFSIRGPGGKMFLVYYDRIGDLVYASKLDAAM